MKLCLYFGNFLSIESNLAVPRCGFLRSSELVVAVSKKFPPIPNVDLFGK